MSTNRKLLFASSAALLVIVAAAPSYHHTRPRVRCAIPERDYQFEKFSQPKRSISSGPDELDAGPPAMGKAAAIWDRTPRAPGEPQREKIKSFQFVKHPKLQIDHCSISQMSVLLHESGTWTVSLRADQNPLNAKKPLNVTTIQPSRRITSDLQRSQFHIVVRCYVGHGPDTDDALLGQPMVIPLYIEPFWVQKQEPYQLFAASYDPHIAQYYASIDRVEIEFAYRLD